MKLVNPKPLDQAKAFVRNLVQSLKLLLGGAAFSVVMLLVFFGGALYAMLAGFAAAAGLVHLFDGPHTLAIILGVIFSFMAIQSGAGLLLFIAAFFGAVYAWEWSWPIALIVFLPGLALIPLGVLAAAAIAIKGQFYQRR